MIKEAIAFVDDFESKNTKKLSKDWKGKKFIIIKIKQEKRNLVSNGFDILEDDSSIEQWISKNPHYETTMEGLDKYVKSRGNKSLGSMAGLLSSAFFAFNLSEKNLLGLSKKIDKTKFSEKETNHQVNIDIIHSILKDAIPVLTKKTDGIFQYLKYLVLISVDKEMFEKWKKTTDDYIEESMSVGKKTNQTYGECFVCKQQGSISNPSFLNNDNNAKPFLKHVTRSSTDGKGISLLVCQTCGSKLNEFGDILKEYKLKIFPLFVNPETRINGINSIKYFKYEVREDKNTFAFVFDQLAKRKEENLFDFYLFVNYSNTYFFFDYITGYNWRIGDYTNFFNKESIEKSITRQRIEKEALKILSLRLDDKTYFGKIDGKDNQQTSMIYSIRQKLFDFVYRNKNSITSDDLQNIVLFRIEKEIRNTFVDIKICKESLNLFFNKGLILQNTNKNESVLNRVKSARDTISSGNFEKFEVKNDEEWAYFAGQLAYYLISLSQSDKKYDLLEPFTNKSTTKLVKIAIQDMFERYKHEIGLNNMRFRVITTKILSYEIDRSFIDLKISFYTGAFDDNIIYYKK